MKKDIKRFLNPPKKAKLHENITAQLRDLIHTKKLALDDKLPSERELANILGVSRVVVRESIQSLEQAGLIEIRTGPTGGAFIVQKLDKPVFLAASDMFKGGNLTLQHFYEARKAIETAIIRITVEKVKPQDIDELKTLNNILLAEIDDKVSLRKNNRAFHIAIAEIAGNPLLTMMLPAILELLDQTYPDPKQPYEFIEKTHERHNSIIEALEKKDAVRCDALMATDTEFTKKIAT
ncbi:MAG: FCD domain-containing protein [Desulfobacula sp.]|jgi:GntR family transcriptional repressor for pyruvate dehydrogenase complex